MVKVFVFLRKTALKKKQFCLHEFVILSNSDTKSNFTVITVIKLFFYFFVNEYYFLIFYFTVIAVIL